MADFSSSFEASVRDVLDGDDLGSVRLGLDGVEGNGGEGDCLSKKPGNAAEFQ